MMENFTGSKQLSTDEMAEQLVKDVPPPTDIPKGEISNWRQKLLKSTKSRLWKIGRGTRYWWNFHTIREKIDPTATAWSSRRTGQIVLRTFVLLPITAEVINIGLDPDKNAFGSVDDNIIVHGFRDITKGALYLYDMWGPAAKNITETVVENAVIDISKRMGHLVDPTTLKKDVELSAITLIDNVGGRDTIFNCDDIISKSNSEIIQMAMIDQKDIIVNSELKTVSELSGIDTEDYTTLKTELDKYFKIVVGNKKTDSKFIKMVEEKRKECLSNKITDVERIEFLKDDYEVTVIFGDSTGNVNVK